MKTAIPVSTRDEAAFIQRGMLDPEMRAMVLLSGILGSLTPDAAKRVLSYAGARLAEGMPAAGEEPDHGDIEAP